MYSGFATRFLANASLLALIAISANVPSQAMAATAEEMAANTGLETVVVTAERRSVDLQKTSISATVLSGSDLTKKNINTIDALAFATPSLTIQDTGENVLLNIRGIGKSYGGVQDPSGVLIYRDGVSASPGGFLADEPYYDLAAVEVLRGPQGTLAGQNATGGALFVRENDPSLDGVSGWVEAQYGNYNDVRLRGAVNMPLSDDLAVRVATNDEYHDTFYNLKGPWTGNPGNHKEADGRVSILWQPTQALKVVWKNDYMYIDHGGSPATVATNTTRNLFNLTSDAHLMGIEEGIRSVLQVSYQFDSGITLKSIGGFQWFRTDYDLDYDGTDLVAPAGNGPRIYTIRSWERTMSEEVNLLSPDTGPLTWVLGGVYQNEVVDIPFRGFVESAAPGGTATSGLATAVGYDTPINAWGIFGQASYDFNPMFQLQVGARYSDTQMRMSDDLQVLFSGVPILNHPVKNEKESDSRLTGKVALNVHLDDQNLLYAFVATGHKQGGINPLASTAAPAGTPPPLFKPEEVTDYELGWKSSFLGDTVRTQIDGFYDAYKNYQIGIFDTSTGLTQLLNVPGQSTVDGIEAQVQGAFGPLSVDANLSYLNSSIGTFSALDSRFPGLGVQSLTGRMLPDASRWTTNLGVQYAFDLGDDDVLTPRIDYGMTGARWATIFMVNPNDRLDADNLVNATLTYDRGDNWEFTAYATNLFDLHYVSSLSLGTLAEAGAPQQFGIRVTHSF